ncbi:MAG: hypothetical protein S4CHLAM102_12250 [Chlamydiia bacterium]|nr:hypothetical protein [Chlamydiia bacterium]
MVAKEMDKQTLLIHLLKPLTKETAFVQFDVRNRPIPLESPNNYLTIRGSFQMVKSILKRLLQSGVNKKSIKPEELVGY